MGVQQDDAVTLAGRCLGLPFKERVELRDALTGSIERDRIRHDPDRFGVLLGYMERIVGFPIQDKSRESSHAWARAMVASQLIDEGFSTVEIGRMMGKDHSTVSYMRKKMRDALAYECAYKDIVGVWKQFQKMIQDEVQ